MQTRHLTELLIVAILVILTAPLSAQRQQQNVAKLKADARNLVGIIGSDKTKTQTYCQIEERIVWPKDKDGNVIRPSWRKEDEPGA